MKSAVFALLLVVAGAFAFPQSEYSRPSLEERIKNVIEQISKRIKEGGYDPWELENAKYERIIAPEVIEFVAQASDVTFAGASVIEINNLHYAPFINRLTFDVSLPELKLTIGNAGIDAIFFQYALDAQLSGSLTVSGIRAAGEINFNIDLIDGVTVRSITIDFYFGIVQSNLSLDINGRSLSEGLNRVLGVSIPAFLDDNRNEINRGMETMVRFLIDNLYN